MTRDDAICDLFINSDLSSAKRCNVDGEVVEYNNHTLHDLAGKLLANLAVIDPTISNEWVDRYRITVRFFNSI